MTPTRTAPTQPTYAEKVAALEAEGLTTSDAQSEVDASMAGYIHEPAKLATAAQTKAALKVASTAYIASVNGAQWIGTPYFAACTARPGPGRDALHAYNLGDHVGRLEVNGTVQIVPDSEAPALEKVIPTDSHLVELVPVVVPGTSAAPCHTYAPNGRQLSVFTAHDDRIVALDTAYLAVIGNAALRQQTDKPAGAVIAYDPHSASNVGVIMPVRLG